MKSRFSRILLALLLMGVLGGSATSETHARQWVSSHGLFAWGAGGHGQLGTGKLYLKGCFCVRRPGRIKGMGEVVQVATGFRFGVALRRNGTVWTWGANDSGQLGIGFISTKRCECVRIPTKVRGVSHIRAISAAGAFVLALADNGSVWAWGSNSSGELGLGVNPFGEKGCVCKDHPTRLRGLPRSTEVSAGTGRFGLALDRNGHVWAWGENMTGALGLHITNTENCLCQPGPSKIGGLPKIRQVSAGGGFSAAVDTKGGVWVWGVNDQSQLALPPITSGICACIDYPIRVSGIPPAIMVSAGVGFTLVLTDDGHLWGWGANYEGDLAAGKASGIISKPVRGARSYRFAQVTSGGATSMAFTRAGTLLAWGRDTTGQFGNGILLSRGCGCSGTPVKVMKNARDVAVGPGFVLAVR